MTKLNVIGVDLAKNVIQVSVLSPSNRELRNNALSRRKFAEFLARQRASLVGISKRVANRRLRAVLIQGARAYVYHMKEPKTTKDRWLWAIVERNGKCKAAAAPAKKKRAHRLGDAHPEYRIPSLSISCLNGGYQKEFSERPASDRRYPLR